LDKVVAKTVAKKKVKIENSLQVTSIIKESWRSSVVEQLICNQQVGGSNPFASSTFSWTVEPGIEALLPTEATEEIEKVYLNKIFNGSVFSVARRSDDSEIASSVYEGEVAEWTKAADCKSAGASLRRFESCPPHQCFGFKNRVFATEVTEKMEKGSLNRIFKSSVFSVAISEAGVAQLARASAFQAEGRGFESRLPLEMQGAHVAQSAEHILGKDEVSGSSPLVGSSTTMHDARYRMQGAG
jgi:hypothetical protein